VQARAKKSAPLAPKSVIVDEYAVLQKKLPASSPAVFGFGEPSRTDALHQDMRVMREQNAVTIPSPASNKADVAAALRPPAAPPLHDAPIRAAESNSLILSQAPAGTSGLIANTDNAASVSGPVASDSVSATPGPVSQQENVPTAAAAPARAAAARRPAINAGTALSAMKTGAIGGPNVPGDASSVPQVACSTIADGLRCVYGTRTTELHKPDAKLNAFATMAENVWVGGKALFRSADAGSTWTEVNKPSDESVSQIVIMADAVYVRTPSGRMWKTTDNGATWLQTSATK
jgi:hypothetical protein